MDPNYPVFANTLDTYDAYFQDEPGERYIRSYQEFESIYGFVRDQESEWIGDRGTGSMSESLKRGHNITRNEKRRKVVLIDDYFGDEEIDPKYTEENFRRRSRAPGTTLRADAFDEYIALMNRTSTTMFSRKVLEMISKELSESTRSVGGFIRQHARAFDNQRSLKWNMLLLVMLHNMILEDEDFVVNLRDVFVDPTPDRNGPKDVIYMFENTKNSEIAKYTTIFEMTL
ncbi:hypothetical protein Tco_0018043 [Tanacetum coccineum]